MKNKIITAMLGLLTFIALPHSVDAATTGKLNINCGTGQVYLNKTITCNVTTTVTGGQLVSLEVDVENSSGISIESFTFANSWNNKSYKNGHIAVVGSAQGGTVPIGTLTIKGVSEGSSTITLKNALGGDDSWSEFDIPTATTTVTVKKQTTKPTTTKSSTTSKTTTRTRTTSKATTTTSTKKPTIPTTKPTTTTSRVTIAPNQSTTTLPTTSTTTSTTTTQYNPGGTQGTTETPRPGAPGTTEIRTSVHYYTDAAGKVIYSEAFIRTDNYYNEMGGRKTKPYEQHVMGVKAVYVDDYKVIYKDGKYYTTVDPDDEEVEIIVETTERVMVIGTGTRGLGVGKNVVDIYMRDDREEKSFQIIINRPDGLNVGDTNLATLKVVDYELEFQPNIYKYEVTVPYTTKELYVIAKHASEYATIGGDGLQTLMDDENQTIYVHVSYGKLQETEYVITVKKSYTMLVLWIVIGLLGVGLIAMALYAYATKKNAVFKVTAEKDAIIASGNRAVTSEVAQGTVIGGEKLSGIAKKTVKPTVVETKPVVETAPTQSALDRVPNRVANPVIKLVSANSPYQQESEIVIKDL